MFGFSLTRFSFSHNYRLNFLIRNPVVISCLPDKSFRENAEYVGWEFKLGRVVGLSENGDLYFKKQEIKDKLKLNQLKEYYQELRSKKKYYEADRLRDIIGADVIQDVPKKGKKMDGISTQMALAADELDRAKADAEAKEITTQSPEVTGVVEEVTTPVVI